MTQQGILNPDLLAHIAKIGHTEYFVIADAGLPLPREVPVVDISLTRGIPGFADTLRAVCGELMVERCILAQEICEKNPQLHDAVCKMLPQIKPEFVAHEQFKSMLKQAKAIVRTGETTPYANCILVGGVNF